MVVEGVGIFRSLSSVDKVGIVGFGVIGNSEGGTSSGVIGNGEIGTNSVGN